MPERVAQPGTAGAEDLLDDVSIDGCAGMASLSNGRLDIIDVQDETDRRTSSWILGRPCARVVGGGSVRWVCSTGCPKRPRDRWRALG